MAKYKCKFRVDGRVTEQIVSAINMTEAKKIVEAQYASCKIQWIDCRRVF